MRFLMELNSYENIGLSTVASTANTVMGLNPLAALVAVAAGIISLLLGAFLVGGTLGGTKL